MEPARFQERSFQGREEKRVVYGRIDWSQLFKRMVRKRLRVVLGCRREMGKQSLGVPTNVGGG